MHTSLDEFEFWKIGPSTTELAALEHLEIDASTLSLVAIDPILFKLAS